ncbi:MAG: hypothetical protein II684_04730, partial [Treponema sp.]|nr:hypothetical protein [Treponema sp.]
GRELATKIWLNGPNGKEPRSCGYWASSTVPDKEEYARYYDFDADRAGIQWKCPNTNYKYSCAIHAFD